MKVYFFIIIFLPFIIIIIKCFKTKKLLADSHLATFKTRLKFMINLCVSLFCRAHIPSTSTTTFYSLVLMICVYVGVLPCAQLKSMFSPQLMMMMTMMVRVSYGDTHNGVFNGFSLAFLCIFVTYESKQQ